MTEPENIDAWGEAEWSAVVGAEARVFFEPPAYPPQQWNDASIFVTAEYSHYWNDARQSFTVVPFARLDSADSERTHFDLREAVWRNRADDWELAIGFDQVFWGVTESQHLVDIVNQTDLVENPDGEEKLGQPMIHLTLLRDWGNLDLFALPWFRERTFPGPDGRLRLNPPVDSDASQYESSKKQAHVDFAIRWSDVLGPWDIGLSHFYGTVRDPAFSPSTGPGPPSLIPFYSIINQTGLDAQLLLGAWAWKLESVYRTGQGPDWFAATGGFEYTMAGFMDSRADVGLLLEYLYADDRVNVATPFPDDFFLGMRLDLNDVQSTRVLAGVYQSRTGDGTLWNVEANRRIGEDWRIDLELRIWNDFPQDNVNYFAEQDDYFGITLSRYF